jgi:hypothetical protein
MKLGSTDISKIYLGSTEVSKAYLGSVQVHGGSSPVQPYIDWLKSLGCICWLPLSSEGDLLDRISGKSLELTGNGSLVWNSSAGMYVLTNPSGAASTYVAFLDNGMNKQTFADDTITSMGTVQRISTTGSIGSFVSPLSTEEYTQMATTPAYNNTGDLTRWDNSLHKCSLVYNNDVDRKYYFDGQLEITAAAYNAYIPRNWSLTGSGLCIGMLRNSTPLSSYRNKQIYLKDVYIFNKCLTLEKIRQIQGYDQLPSGVQL